MIPYSYLQEIELLFLTKALAQVAITDKQITCYLLCIKFSLLASGMHMYQIYLHFVKYNSVYGIFQTILCYVKLF